MRLQSEHGNQRRGGGSELNQKRKIVLAAVQMRVGDSIVPQRLLQNSVKYVEQAAGAGASIVAFPELFPSYGHFKMGLHLWEFAEPWEGGMTQTFFSALAKRCGVYICTSLLLVQGLDFYNTFVLISPEGKVVARLRKNYTTAFESFYWRLGYGDARLIETDFGRIGVGLCAENVFNILSKELAEESVCLTLHLFSVPDPTQGGLPKPLAEFFKPVFQNMSSRFASTFGCAAVFVNKVGTETSSGGFLAKDGTVTRFFGNTRISDSSGKILADISDGSEGIALAEVDLVQSKSRAELGTLYEQLRTTSTFAVSPLHPTFPWFAYIFLTAVQALGHVYYALSPTRRRIARRIAAKR